MSNSVNRNDLVRETINGAKKHFDPVDFIAKHGISSPVMLPRVNQILDTPAIGLNTPQFEAFKNKFSEMNPYVEFEERELKEIYFACVYARSFGHGTANHNSHTIISKLVETVEKLASKNWEDKD